MIHLTFGIAKRLLMLAVAATAVTYASDSPAAAASATASTSGAPSAAATSAAAFTSGAPSAAATSAAASAPDAPSAAATSAAASAPDASSAGPTAAATPRSGTAPATATPPPINLDTFESLKKTAQLSDGESLAYLTMGDPHGPPVVLIHGYTDNARDWVPLIPYLSKHFHLIVVDLRGHGRSSKPDCCYTLPDFAYDIVLLLDSLGIRRADIVGHSLGSMIAQVFAETWPEHTGKVVLISSTGGPPPGAPPKKPQFDFAAQIRQLKEPLDPDSPFMVSWWDSPTPVDADFIRRQRQDSAGIPLRVWLAVLDQALGNPADLQRTLPRLKAPTLLIWGSADPIMEPEVRATLQQALPQARVKIFQGLGHNPFWEDPRACAAVINAFLAPPPQPTH